MDNPSIGEANKVLRVLNGVRLKYTVRVHLPSKEVIEFQADKECRVKWCEEARALWLYSREYDGPPLMAWVDGSILIHEENPKV